MAAPLPRLFLSLRVVQHNWDTEVSQFLGKVTNIRVYRGLAQGEMEEMPLLQPPDIPAVGADGLGDQWGGDVENYAGFDGLL